MPTRVRLLPLLLIAAAMLAFAACGGDDSTAEKKTRESEASAVATSVADQSSSSSSGSSSSAATPAPANATRALQLDCGRDLKSFRFDGKLALQSPQMSSPSSADFSAIIGSLLSDVKFSGAFVAPDRTQFKLEGGQNSLLGSQPIEFIQIGTTSYTKLGNTGWQQGSDLGGAVDFTQNFDPRELCRQIQDNLKGDAPSRKEKVNGVDTTRYDFDRASLERLGNAGGFLGALGENGQLPQNIKLNLWVSDKEKFPVKMMLAASGQEAGRPYSINLDFNVTDLNGNVSINAPR